MTRGSFRAVLAVALSTSLLAGCLSSDSGSGDDPAGGSYDGPAFVNGTWPSGLSARDYIESYIMSHPFRVEGGQQGVYYQFDYMEDARRDLLALLQDVDPELRVEREDYRGSDPGTNIVAYKAGTTHPEQWVVLSAHYDTVGSPPLGPTVYGAWDDGAGTAVLIELARAFSDWEFPFTVVFLFTDGEEKGLRGSRAFVEEHHDPANSTIDIVANINTDPPGLNWPCGDATGSFPVKIIHETIKAQGNDTEAPIARYAWLYDAMEYALNGTSVPPEVVDYSAGIPVAVVGGQGVRGGSDHQSFGRVGIANVYVGGTPTTHVPPGSGEESAASALTYSFHTPLDTLQQLEERCRSGGPESTLSNGLQTTVSIYAHTLTYLATTEVPAPDYIEAPAA